MEEKMVKLYLEQLERADSSFMSDLTPAQQWELGTSASHWERPLHLNGLDWNPESSELSALNRVFGAEIVNYGWSIIDTTSHAVVGCLPFLMGAMAELGFGTVGLQEGTWYEADQEITSSMDIEEKREALAKTFWLKVRFYPNPPGEDKRPPFAFPNIGETASQVLETARDRSDIIDARNKLWWSSYHATPISKKYEVLSRLESLEPRVTRDGENAVFRELKEPNELVFFREAVLLVRYKLDVVAFGPDAILMA